MNPRPDAPSDLLYGFPVAHWRIPAADLPSPLTQRLYMEAREVLTEPDGPIARQWAAELSEDGYRAVTAPLSLPQVVSLVSELPPSAIVRLTGRTPDDAARQEVVRMLYAPVED